MRCWHCETSDFEEVEVSMGYIEYRCVYCGRVANHLPAPKHLEINEDRPEELIYQKEN
jgi:hypothetical protein